MEKTVGIIIKIALLVAIFVLAYFIVVGIQKPIKFEEQRNRRTNLTIDRLKDIRTAQIAYKNIYGRFTPSFDTLIRFIKTENLRVVRAIGFVPDSLTEAQAIKLKLVSRDTFFVPIIDSLFKHINYPIDSIRFSPTGKRIEFKMDTASVMTGSNVEVVKV